MTVSHILAIRRIIEGVKNHNRPAVITFFNFKKAFNSIHRGKMIKILQAYGIPEKLAHAIETMYQNTKTHVLMPDGDTEQTEIAAGVMQGDTLASFLFFIILNYALRGALDGCEEQLGSPYHPEDQRDSPQLH